MGMSDDGYGGLQHGTFGAKHSPLLSRPASHPLWRPVNEMNAQQLITECTAAYFKASYSRFCPRVPSEAVSARRERARNEIVVQTEDDSVNPKKPRSGHSRHVTNA